MSLATSSRIRWLISDSGWVVTKGLPRLMELITSLASLGTWPAIGKRRLASTLSRLNSEWASDLLSSSTTRSGEIESESKILSASLVFLIEGMLSEVTTTTLSAWSSTSRLISPRWQLLSTMM